MLFVPLSSVVTLHDLYFHEITLPINASQNKFFFIFNKLNILAIIAFGGWWRKRKQEIPFYFHIKYKYISLQVSQWSEPFTNTFILRQINFSCGNFTSFNSFRLQVFESNNSILMQWYIYNSLSHKQNLGFKNLIIL